MGQDQPFPGAARPAWERVRERVTEGVSVQDGVSEEAGTGVRGGVCENMLAGV